MDFIELIDSYKEDIIKSTQEIVRIRSVEGEKKDNMPFGEGVYLALQYALNLAKDMGFKVKNIDNYAGHAELGEGDETVGVLVHLDVVPEGDGWTYPPFGGEIHDGKIYGRGTVDDKGPAIACLYAMKALKESDLNLNRKIRIIFGTDEESGWECVKHYFKHEKAPDMAFTPDAEFPVIYEEKGIIIFDLVKKIKSNQDGKLILKSLKGGNAPNMVPDYCEAVIETEDLSQIEDKFNSFVDTTNYPLHMKKEKNTITISAEGISAHGSTPEKGKNAITYLMAFLGKIFKETSDIGEFIKVYNERIAFKHHGESIGAAFEDDISGKLNFNPGMIRLENDEIRLTINIRYPIKLSARKIYDGIRNNLKDTNVELVEGEDDSKPLYVPKDSELVKKLMKVYREQTKDIESQPITIGGGTYARALKNAVAFGPVFPGQEDVVHQKDEYISIDHLMKITKIYAHALYELAK